MLPGMTGSVPSLLAVDIETKIRFHKIQLSDGSGFFSRAEHILNPDSVILAIGGDLDGDTLIMSDINTMAYTKRAIEIHNSFKKLVFAKTEKFGEKGSMYRLMPGAVSKLKMGWRFTADKRWSKEIDARIPIPR
jgi:hypothetical protein